MIGAVAAALENAKTDPVAKRHLVWVLDAIAGATPEASYPLIDALESTVADVRAQAARALGERSVPIAREPLVELLKDPEPTVRLQAVIALGRIGDALAIPALLPLVAEPDTFLAYSARQALKRIDDWPVATQGPRFARPQGSRRRLARDEPGVRRRGRRQARGVRLVAGSPGRRTHQGDRVPGRGRSQSSTLERQMVGYPTRLGRNRRPGRSPGTERLAS